MRTRFAAFRLCGTVLFHFLQKSEEGPHLQGEMSDIQWLLRMVPSIASVHMFSTSHKAWFTLYMCTRVDIDVIKVLCSQVCD